MFSAILPRIVDKAKRRFFGSGVVNAISKFENKRHCLLSYLTEPFQKRRIALYHQNVWQVVALAEMVSEFGFNVDVIDFRDRKVLLKREYHLVIDVHPGPSPAYLHHLSNDCRKIAYITGSNPSHANRAEQERLNDVFRRTGTRLKPRRYAVPFPKSTMESFDAMFFIGNKYNLETYREFDLQKVCFIKNTGYEFLRNEDFTKKSSRDFLFLGGYGQVHKGLDLLLTVFSRNPDINLHVCSSLRKERDFVRLYKKELFGLENVFTYGYVDIKGDTFRKLARICAFSVLPSCAEGISGSALTCMSAGVIPILSRECGLESDETHFFRECSIECIEETVRRYSAMDGEWVRKESLRIMDIAQTRYGRKNYLESVRIGLREVLA